MLALLALLLLAPACQGGRDPGGDSAPGGDGGGDTGGHPDETLCGVALRSAGTALAARVPDDQAVRLSWGYVLGGVPYPLGDLEIPAGASAELPLLGMLPGSTARVSVLAEGCDAQAELAVPGLTGTPLGNLLRTKGASTGLERELWMLPVISTAGSAILAFNAEGRLVWSLPVPPTSHADPEGDAGAYVGSFPRIRRVRVEGGRLVAMIEALMPGQGCTFRSTALTEDPATAVPEDRVVDRDCHHDFVADRHGATVLPAWDAGPYADAGLLVDRIVALDADGAATVLAQVEDHVDISDAEIAALQAYANGSPSGDVTNLTYVNGGHEEARPDGGSVSWWLFNLAEDGILRIARDGTGAVTGITKVTDDPTTSDYTVALEGLLDQLILAPHGIACRAEADGTDTCYLHNRGFEFLRQFTDVSCTSVTAFQLDPGAGTVTLRWHQPVLDNGGQCLPSYVHGNVTLAERADGSLVSTFASGAFTLGGDSGPTRPLAVLVTDGVGQSLLQLETPIPDAETVRMAGFLSGPYDVTDIARDALDATRELP